MPGGNVNTNRLLNQQRIQLHKWETAKLGSREEWEAAEAHTSVSAALDLALCDGEPLPDEWQRARDKGDNTKQEDMTPWGGGEDNGWDMTTTADEPVLMNALRANVTAKLDASEYGCARCKTCDRQVDAVMAAVRESLFGGESEKSDDRNLREHNEGQDRSHQAPEETR